MNGLQRAMFQAIGPLLVGKEAGASDTAKFLRRARFPILPEWYTALSYVGAFGAGVVGLVISAFFIPPLAIPGAKVLFVIGVGVVCALITRTVTLIVPRVAATARARRIDADFPNVATLAYSLAQGGVGIVDIFRVVTEEKEAYNDISSEFALVIYEVDILGQDILQGLQTVAETTPSRTLRGFFEGLVTVLRSGAEPRDYFKRQTELQLANAENELEKELEGASLLAEVYVSGLLVLPLLLLVILSVLSMLGGSNPQFIPLIVFGLMPLGTLGYLVLVDTLMPAPSLDPPRARKPILEDCGLDTYPADAPRLAPFAGRAAGLDSDAPERGRTRKGAFRIPLGARIANLATRIVNDSQSAAIAAGVGAGTVFVTMVISFSIGGDQSNLLVKMTAALGAACVAAALPAIAFHEARVGRARSLERDLPEALSKLASFNDRGLSLLRAFEISGRSAAGKIGDVFRSITRDVGWYGSLGAALSRLRSRVPSRRVIMLSILFERASAATGNLKEVLDIAAKDATKVSAMDTRKRQSMMSYVLVIYVVFAVFLYVIIMVARLLVSQGEASAAAATSIASGTGGFGQGIDAAKSRLTFLHAVVIQGVCSGFVAGKLGEGYISSGIKHATILAVLGWAVYELGVSG